MTNCNIYHTPDVSDVVSKKLLMSGGSARGEDVERGEAVGQRGDGGDRGDVPLSGRDYETRVTHNE